MAISAVQPEAGAWLKNVVTGASSRDGLHLAVDAAAACSWLTKSGWRACRCACPDRGCARRRFGSDPDHPEPLLRQRLLLQQRTDACNRKVHGQVVNDLAAADHRVADGDALRPVTGSRNAGLTSACVVVMKVRKSGRLGRVRQTDDPCQPRGCLADRKSPRWRPPHVRSAEGARGRSARHLDDRWGRRERRDDGGIPTQLAIDGQRDGSRNFLHALIDLRRLRTIDRIGAIQRKRECRGYNGNDQPNQTGANRHGARVPDGSATLERWACRSITLVTQKKAGLIADDRGAGPGFRLYSVGFSRPGVHRSASAVFAPSPAKDAANPRRSQA